jgi:hypothetical protein
MDESRLYSVSLRAPIIFLIFIIVFLPNPDKPVKINVTIQPPIYADHH